MNASHKNVDCSDGGDNSVDDGKKNDGDDDEK